MKKNFNPLKPEKNLKTAFFFLLVILASTSGALAQDEEKKEPEKKESDAKPAKPAFESSQLMDDQSAVVYSKKTLEFNMQHRFGTVENGVKDLFGIYGSAN